MGVREIDRSLEQWQMGVKDLRRRMILAPTPRERERWYAILLLAQEHLPADLALLALVLQVGNGRLVHTASSTISIRLFRLTMPHRRGLVQKIPKPHR